MTLSALLVCPDETSAEVLRRVLEELTIRVEVCPDMVRATMRLALARFDVVIVDAASNAEVISLLRESRLSRLNDATLAVAVVPGKETIRELFSLGVNFVLYKPVEYERALSSLRAARAVMRKEKRKSARATVHAHATVDYANVQQENATLVDLAKDGMAIRFGKRFPPTSKVYFQFRLPEQATSVRLSGQVIWQDWNGRAGVQFIDVPKTSRRILDDFLSTNLPAETRQEQFSDVMVEVEEPVVTATVAVAPKGHSGEKMMRAGEERAAAQPTAVEDAPTQPDADNRRTQTRYACRLGAEVYRTGTSVPNHCCLTDLSGGGCYLEVALPFPKDSTIEILVRTYQMKLRLRGTVLASHPGYGMGVAFELKTNEERENVKKLTDFVAATIKPS